MTKKYIDISDDVWEQEVKAVKVFTDREDPQEAFERKFRVLSRNWRKTFYVLCYYGIGGIGKTSFINKLCRVIRGVDGNECRVLDKIDCNYIKYDFGAKDAGLDKLSILLNWRKQLGEVDKNFKFYRFDSAVLLYGKKSGNSFEKDETAQSLLNSNPWLSVVVDTVEIIPIAGWVANAIRIADQSFGMAKDIISKHIDKERYRIHLNEIDSLEPSEILEKLHEYLILDMRHNMQHVAAKPLVIFLDTYEKYIDTVNREISMITEDFWLRKGRKSVIQSIPGVLWVITGREKLYWADDDEIWNDQQVERPFAQMSEEEKEELAEEYLEQHLLGDLSIKDATYFLQQAGIHDEQLCEQLYQLTNGTPLFLDLCVNTHDDLVANNKKPTIKDFGEDLTELISRYLSSMDKANKEMSYFLACLGTWTKESVYQIVKEAKCLKAYTNTQYEAFIDHSFIIRNQDGSCYMHETVRTAVLKNADKEIINEVNTIRLSILKKNIEAGTTLDSNTALSEYVKVLTECDCEYDEYYKHLIEVRDRIKDLVKAGSYELVHLLSRELFLSVKKKYPNTGIEMIARSMYGNALRYKGKFKEALELVSDMLPQLDLCEITEEDSLSVKESVANIYSVNGVHKKAYELDELIYIERRRILGENHPDTLVSQANLAKAYYNIGNPQEAIHICETVLEIQTRVLGEEHPCTLESKAQIARYYESEKEYRVALELRKEILEQRRRILGEEHPSTLGSMQNLAISYDNMGLYQKAFELKREALERMKLVLGDDHPNTLASMGALAFSYYRIEEKQKALELREEVLERSKGILGEEHPNTLWAMSQLAFSYSNMGEQQKALELREEVLEKNKRILGEEHPNTFSAMDNLIISYYHVGEQNKAVELGEELLKKRRRVLGEEHPDTYSTMKNLAILHEKQGDFVRAQELRQKMSGASKSALRGEKNLAFRKLVEMCTKSN